MGDIQSQAKLFIDGPFGSFQLVRVKTADFDDERDGEVVTAIGVKGGAGARFKEGGGEIKFEVYSETGTPEVDYLDLLNRRVFFAITRQKVPGQRHQFRGVFVAKYSEKEDDQGNNMLSITLKYMSVVLLPS
jgi:hypothetical protein